MQYTARESGKLPVCFERYLCAVEVSSSDPYSGAAGSDAGSACGCGITGRDETIRSGMQNAYEAYPQRARRERTAVPNFPAHRIGSVTGVQEKNRRKLF